MDLSGSDVPPAVKTPEHYICDIPLTKRKELCSYLDKMEVWTQLAQQMHFPPEQIAVSFFQLPHFSMN